MAERIKIERLHAGYRLLAYPHRSVVVQAQDLLDIMDFALEHAEQLRQEAEQARQMDLKSKGVYTVRVHFISGEERIVPAKDIQFVGEEGAKRGTALVDGREVPIYKRSEPEWGPLWYEQEVNKDTFLNQVLTEMDGFDGVLLPQDFHNYIVGRDGTCRYTVDELEAWLNAKSEEQEYQPIAGDWRVQEVKQQDEKTSYLFWQWRDGAWEFSERIDDEIKAGDFIEHMSPVGKSGEYDYWRH